MFRFIVKVLFFSMLFIKGILTLVCAGFVCVFRIENKTIVLIGFSYLNSLLLLPGLELVLCICCKVEGMMKFWFREVKIKF